MIYLLQIRWSKLYRSSTVPLTHMCSKPSTRRPIYLMGQRPVCSRGNYDMGLPTKLSLSLHRFVKFRQLMSITIWLPHTRPKIRVAKLLIIINLIMLFDNLAFSCLADKLSSKWAGPNIRRLSRSFDNLLSEWTCPIHSTSCRVKGRV